MHIHVPDDPKPALFATVASCAAPLISYLHNVDAVLHVLTQLVGIASGVSAACWYIYSYRRAKNSK